jgi:hypothetical protein
MAVKAAPVIELPKLRIETAKIRLVGDSSLVVHKWSEKAKEEMRAKQMKKAKKAKEAKNPVEDFLNSMYIIDANGRQIDLPGTLDIDNPDHVKDFLSRQRFGFPAVAFKSAAVDACSHVDGVTKVEARGAFHLLGDFVEIEGKPVMREDLVRVGMGTADLRYRAEFNPWAATLTIQYNANVLSVDQIANLFNTAGFAIGVGEGRPQRDYVWGRFHVEVTE